MEKTAIFLNGEYYLLPDSISSFDDFVAIIKMRGKVKVKLKKLNEIKCMAPYFVDKAITEEFVIVDETTPIYSTKVSILTEKEYHDRLLKAVLKVCPGCARYTDDGDYTHLDGHHEEISLDSVCLIRCENDEEVFYELYDGVVEFAERFAENKKTLEKLIDDNKIDEAKHKLNEEIAMFMPVPLDFCVAKQKRKYVCYFPTFNNDAMSLCYYFVCNFLNKQNIEGWQFCSYLPSNVLPKNNTALPSIFIHEIETINGTQKLINFYMNDCELETFKNTYLAVANDIGEDRLLQGTSDSNIWFSNDKVGKEISFKDFKKEIIKAKSKPSYFKDGSPIPVARAICSYDENGVPNKLATYCTELFFAVFNNLSNFYENEKISGEWLNVFDDLGVSIGKLSINVENSVYANQITEGLVKSLDKILDNDYSFNFAKEYVGSKFNIYFLIFEHNKFLMELKRHSPIFENFEAEFEITTINEYKKFKVNFEFDCIENKKIKLAE